MESLEHWRRQVDELDEQLLVILAKRAEAVREIGKLKKAYGVAPLDEKRWRHLLRTRLSQAASLNLSLQFIEKLFNLIHDYSLEMEADSD